MTHDPRDPAVLLLTGVQAAGKSTVAQALAERLPRSVHLRGDVFRRAIVGGRADMTPEPSAEAMAQLRLRYRLAATVADEYFAAGFTVILQDVVLGPELPAMVELICSRPRLVIVLAPRPEVVAGREAGRHKNAYGPFSVEGLDRLLREGTERIGLWLDTSDQTVDETVEEILARAWDEAVVR
jgi:predicted kinase